MIKRLLFHSLLILVASGLTPRLLTRAQGADPNAEIESGAVVCAPEVYFDVPGDCLPIGPSEYLTELAKRGIRVPDRPLPAAIPDGTLTQLPYFYFKLDKDMVPILSGPNGDSTTGQSFAPGFVYVSY